jgi:hypothetical protein
MPERISVTFQYIGQKEGRVLLPVRGRQTSASRCRYEKWKLFQFSAN